MKTFVKYNFFFLAVSVTSLLLVSCASTKKTEAAPIIETKAAEPSVEVLEDDEEYTRSTNNMEGAVTKDVFTEDKKIILEIINNLDKIMKSDDYSSWVNYIDKESLTYWQNPKNLHKAESKLPVKGLKLNDLEDYFHLVFIQSRVGRQIDEIRYISDSSVKAVQVREDQDVVYYYFHKINGIWKLHLPPLED